MPLTPTCTAGRTPQHWSLNLNLDEESAMRKVSFICTVVLALALGFTLPATAQEPQTVAGDWTAPYTGLGGERLVFYLSLKQDGEKVTGTFSNPGAGGGVTTDRPITGTFRDGVLTIGPGIKGTVTGDTMTETIRSAAGPLRDFAATRKK